MDRENESAIEDRVSTRSTHNSRSSKRGMAAPSAHRGFTSASDFSPFSSLTSGPCVRDIQPTLRDNENLIGAGPRCVRLPRRPSKLPQPHWSALFDIKPKQQTGVSPP